MLAADKQDGVTEDETLACLSGKLTRAAFLLVDSHMTSNVKTK